MIALVRGIRDALLVYIAWKMVRAWIHHAQQERDIAKRQDEPASIQPKEQ